jgi:ubiquinone/menaquinone biosynthesis C-methylase UbiE
MHYTPRKTNLKNLWIAMNKERVIKTNQEAWNEAAPIHKKYYYNRLLRKFKRPGYSCIKGIKQDTLLAHGLEGKAVFQPCCNNGRDLLSIKNLGAKRCVGFDFCSEFIEHGKEFAAAGGIECELIHADVYKLDKQYDGQFDIAYITAGTLWCLPDLDGFFAVVSRLMRPGAWLFMYEFHPILAMYGMEPSKRLRWLRLRHSYFMKEPYIAKKGLNYYRSKAYRAKPCYLFHYKLSDIIQAIVNSGLMIETFQERDITSEGKFKKLTRKKNRLPLTYIITANRPLYKPANPGG